MPEYLTPGVYVEETSFRSKSIEGVSTSTTGFVGPTRRGPIGGTPELLTSFADFERIYGGFGNVEFVGAAPRSGGQPLNYMAHAVRAYFDNGGQRLYVSRVWSGDPDEAPRAQWPAASAGDPPPLTIRARQPGSGGNGEVEVVVLETPAAEDAIVRAPEGTLLRFAPSDAADLTTARMDGGRLPLTVLAGSVLRLRINGAVHTATFGTADANNPALTTQVTSEAVAAALVPPLEGQLSVGSVPDPFGEQILRLETTDVGPNARIEVLPPAAGEVQADLGLPEPPTEDEEPGEAFQRGAGRARAPRLDIGVPFPVEIVAGSTLVMEVGVEPTTQTVTFAAGQPASITAGAAPDGNAELADTITITVNGAALEIATANLTRTDATSLATSLNAELEGEDEDAEDPVVSFTVENDRLVITTALIGASAQIETPTVAALGFTGQETAGRGTGINPAAVTAEDLAELMNGVEELSADVMQNTVGETIVRLETEERGSTARIEVTGGAARGALGIPTDTPTLTFGTGTGQATQRDWPYLLREGAWRNRDQNLLPLPIPDDMEATVLTFSLVARDGDGGEKSFEDLGFHPEHPRFISKVLEEEPTRRTDDLENSIWAERTGTDTAFQVYDALFGGTDGTRTLTLTGGSDGALPQPADYREALISLRRIEGISIVAAPGAAAYADPGNNDAPYQGIRNNLITFVSRRRSYQIGVLDTPPTFTTTEAATTRSQIDSKYAAMYYPWVVVPNPLFSAADPTIPSEVLVPPSGFLCGIYARNDTQRGVYKAPANEVVRGALRFETDVNFAEQAVLNPAGVNCLRFFPGRGYRVWGARLTSSDPEWKYVSDRRYFNYLEASIDRGTQWVVFEPNGERLWANVTETVSSFLYNEWKSGYLLGTSPEEAYFVRCDRTTMTQNDLDNGRLICLIGVAVIKPAEFVIFRIGQKTADARG